MADPPARPLWKTTPLQRVLAGLFGALLGSFFTGFLLGFFAPGTWLVYAPIALCAAAAFWKGDRALLAIVRMLP